MKKAILCVIVVVVLSVSAAFGGVTEDLMRAASDKSTTPQNIVSLIKAGADVNAKDDNGMTALIWAAADNSNVEVIKTLINAGANINAKSYYGMTALMVAAEEGNVKAAELLIKHGADISAKDNTSKSVLDYAKNDEMKRIILNASK